MTIKQSLTQLLEMEDFSQAIEFISLLQNNGMNDFLSRKERKLNMEKFINLLSKEKIEQVAELLLELEILLKYDK